MVADVYHTVRKCSSCARDRILTLFPAREPLESVEVDLLAPLHKSRKEDLCILVVVDRFSKLCRFLAMRSATAEKIAKTFCNE